MAWGNRREVLAAGSPAPSFRLKDLKGNEHTLEGLLASGPVLVAFYKESCPVCQFTFPFLERLHVGAGGAVQFVAVSQDDTRSAERFNREFGITFTTLIDEGRAGYQASNAFGITHVPSCFLIEKDGTVSWAMDGFVKGELESVGRRVGAAPFQPGEYVPEWKAG
ncbi:MAG TPA: redoxin domain-containing protein [Bryobacteraceae bacterium]|nr:redoxin domain-containing protein [Bryobacteraceae bacterium]